MSVVQLEITAAGYGFLLAGGFATSRKPGGPAKSRSPAPVLLLFWAWERLRAGLGASPRF